MAVMDGKYIIPKKFLPPTLHFIYWVEVIWWNFFISFIEKVVKNDKN